jgi:hypothetical protein
MSDLSDYVLNLDDQQLRALYGAIDTFYSGYKAIYMALLRLVDPPRGDLLWITRRDAKLLDDGEVVYRLSDEEPRTERSWWREGSNSAVSDQLVHRSTLQFYLQKFPVILERDEFLQRSMQMIYQRPGELIVKLHRARS